MSTVLFATLTMTWTLTTLKFLKWPTSCTLAREATGTLSLEHRVSQYLPCWSRIRNYDQSYHVIWHSVYLLKQDIQHWSSTAGNRSTGHCLIVWQDARSNKLSAYATFIRHISKQNIQSISSIFFGKGVNIIEKGRAWECNSFEI